MRIALAVFPAATKDTPNVTLANSAPNYPITFMQLPSDWSNGVGTTTRLPRGHNGTSTVTAYSSCYLVNQLYLSPQPQIDGSDLIGHSESYAKDTQEYAELIG